MLPPCSDVDDEPCQSRPSHEPVDTFKHNIETRGQDYKEKLDSKNKSQTRHARAYKVTSFLSTDCELSTTVVILIILYAGKSLTVNNYLDKRIVAFENNCYRRLLHYTRHTANLKIRKIVRIE